MPNTGNFSNTDNRIVNIQFNNKDFEKNAATTLETCEKLDKQLTFKGAVEGLASLSAAAKLFDLSPVVDATETAAKAFSPLEEMAIGALRRIGEEAIQTGEKLISSVTVDQIEAGYGKFDEKTQSVQTIMSATGKTVEEVNEQLQMLNWYTDETSYAYTDMTSNIGKFTNAGVKLEDAVTAMIGIGNAAGLAGANVRDASHAMAGFSKAMGQGYMDRLTWSWIKTAHMDTVQFKQAMIDAGVAAGKLVKLENGMYSVDGYIDEDHLVSAATFENSLTKSKWLTSDIITKTLSKYGATTQKIYDYVKASDFEVYTSEAIEQIGISMEDLGLKAFKASQEAKTFSDALDAVKDAVSTGWMTSFEIIIGNYMEAKKVWTDLANWMYDIFVEMGNERNQLLKDWANEWEFGLEKLGGRAYFLEGVYAIFDTISEYIFAVGDAFEKVFGEDWDANLLRKITQDIHNFAQALASTVENGVFDYQTNNTIRWFVTNCEQLSHILKRVGETLSNIVYLLSTTIFEALGFTSVTRAMKRSWDATGAAIDSNVTKIGKVIYSVLHGINAWLTKNFYGNENRRRLREIVSDIGTVVSNLKDIFVSVAKSIAKAIGTISSSFSDISFAGAKDILSIIKIITGLILNLVTATNTFTGNTKITDIFIGILNFGKIILSVLNTAKSIALFIIASVSEFIVELRNKLTANGTIELLTTSLKELFSAIKDIFASIIGQSTELSEEGTDAEESFSWIKIIADVIAYVADLIAQIIPLATKLAKGIANLITGVRGLFAGEEPNSVGEKKQTIFDVIRNSIESIFDKVDGEKVNEGAKKFSAGIFDSVFSGISNAIKKLDIDWDKVGKFVGFVGFLVGMSIFDSALYKLFHLALGPGGILTGIGAFISGIGGIVTEAREYVAAMSVMSKLKSLALAIAILAGSVWLLGQLPKEALARGIVALTLIATILGVLVKVLGIAGPLINVQGGNTKNISLIGGSKTIAVAGVIIGIAAFVLAVAKAIDIIAKIPLGNLLKGSITLVVMLGALTGILYLVMKMGSLIANTMSQSNVINSQGLNSQRSVSKLSGYLIQLSVVIGAIAFAVMIFTTALNSMAVVAQKNPDGFWKACLAFIGILTMFGVFIAFVAGVEILSTKKWSISGIGRKLIEVSIGMIGIATALSLMLVPVAMLASLQKADVDIDQIMKNLVEYVGIIAAFTFVLSATMGKVRISDIGKSVGMLLATVIALNALIIPISSLSKLQLDGIDSGKIMLDITGYLISIAGVAVVLSYVMKGVSTASAIKAGMLMLTSVLAVIMMLAPIGKLAVLQLAGVDFNGLVENIVILVGAIAGIMYVLTILTRTYKSTKMVAAAGAFLIMSLAIGIIIRSLKSLETMPSLESLIGIGILIVAMAGVLAGLTLLFGKFGGASDLVLIASSFIVLSVGIIAIAGALAILSNYAGNLKWKSIGQLAAVIGILTGAIIVLGAVATYVQGVLPVMKAIATILTSLALVITSFGVALYLVAKALPIITSWIPKFIEVVEKAADTMEDHIGVFLIAAGIIISVAALVTVLLAMFMRSLPSVVAALSAFVDSIGAMSLSGKAVTMAFVLAIAYGLAEATPEVMDTIERVIKTILARLGAAVGWIVDGLLKLIIELLDALAEAIRNNGGPILFAIVDILEAIGELIVDAVAATFGNLANIIFAAIDAIGIWAESPTMTYAEAFAQSFAGLSDSMSESVRGFKEAAKTGMVDVKKFLYGLNGYEDTELKLFGDPEDAEKEGGEFFDKLIESGSKAVSKAGEKIGASEVVEELKKKLLGGEGVSSMDFTKLFNMEGFDTSQMFDLQNFMNQNSFNIDPSTMMNWQEATAGFTDFSTTVTDGNADMEAATVSFTDTAGDATGEYVDELANSNEDAELKLTEGVDKLETIVNNRQDNFKQAGKNLIQALEDGVTEKWEASSELIKSKFRTLAEEIRDILSSDNIYGDIMPVVDASKPYDYNVAAQTALNRNAAEKNTAFAAPMNPTATSTEQVQAASNDISGLQSAIALSSSKLESLIRTTNERLDTVIDDNNLFRKSFNAYREECKDLSIYMDSGELVGAIADDMADAIAIKTSRASRTGG